MVSILEYASMDDDLSILGVGGACFWSFMNQGFRQFACISSRRNSVCLQIPS